MSNSLELIVARLQEEVETLKEQNADLANRLADIEANQRSSGYSIEDYPDDYAYSEGGVDNHGGW